MITSLIALFPLSWPDSLKKLAAWASVAIAATLLLWGAYEAWKAMVIDDHETERAVESMEAHNVSAEQRAMDTIIGIAAHNERERAVAEAEASEAAKPVSERAKLPPTTKALNCARMRQAYTKAALAKMPAYREVC